MPPVVESIVSGTCDAKIGSVEVWQKYAITRVDQTLKNSPPANIILCSGLIEAI